MKRKPREIKLVPIESKFNDYKLVIGVYIVNLTKEEVDMIHRITGEPHGQNKVG